MKSLIAGSLLLLANFAQAGVPECRTIATGNEDQTIVTPAGKICIRASNMKEEGQGQKGKILVSLFDVNGKIKTVIPMGYTEGDAGMGRRYMVIKQRSSDSDTAKSNILFKERLDTSELKKGEVMGSVDVQGAEFLILTEQDGNGSAEE